MTSLTRSLQIGLTAAVATSAIGMGALGAHAATTTAAAAPSAQDQAFVTSNAQSNLAEIALGQLGEARAGDAKTTQLAEVTLRDHETLETHLAVVAKAAGLSLPTAPNAMQMATAATLKATPASAFDGAYAKAEVLGHQLAIAAAKTETTAGSDATITSYATGYIPIAEGHLAMAEAEVAALTGVSATSVSAGSGGLAQTDRGSSDVWVYGMAGGIVLAGAGGAAEVYRRRLRTSSATS